MFEGRGGCLFGGGRLLQRGRLFEETRYASRNENKGEGGGGGSYLLCFSQYFASLTYQN